MIFLFYVTAGMNKVFIQFDFLKYIVTLPNDHTKYVPLEESLERQQTLNTKVKVKLTALLFTILEKTGMQSLKISLFCRSNDII